MNQFCNHYVEIGLGTVDNSDDMQHRKPRRRPNWVAVNVKEKQNGTYKTKRRRNKISVRLWQGDDYMRKCCAKKKNHRAADRRTKIERKRKWIWRLNARCIQDFANSMFGSWSNVHPEQVFSKLHNAGLCLSRKRMFVRKVKWIDSLFHVNVCTIVGLDLQRKYARIMWWCRIVNTAAVLRKQAATA